MPTDHDVYFVGVELVLYFMTLRQVFRIRNRTRMDKFLIVFSTVLLVLNTIYWTTQAYFGQQMWVVHADYPGGMDAFLAAYVAVWYQTWGSAAVMVSNLMADALMVSVARVWEIPWESLDSSCCRCIGSTSSGTTP